MQSTNLIFGGIGNNAINQDLNASFFLPSQWDSFCSALMSDGYDMQNIIQLVVEGCQWAVEARLEASKIVSKNGLVFQEAFNMGFVLIDYRLKSIHSREKHVKLCIHME